MRSIYPGLLLRFESGAARPVRFYRLNSVTSVTSFSLGNAQLNGAAARIACFRGQKRYVRAFPGDSIGNPRGRIGQPVRSTAYHEPLFERARQQ